MIRRPVFYNDFSLDAPLHVINDPKTKASLISGLLYNIMFMRGQSPLPYPQMFSQATTEPEHTLDGCVKRLSREEKHRKALVRNLQQVGSNLEKLCTELHSSGKNIRSVCISLGSSALIPKEAYYMYFSDAMVSTDCAVVCDREKDLLRRQLGRILLPLWNALPSEFGRLANTFIALEVESCDVGDRLASEDLFVVREFFPIRNSGNVNTARVHVRPFISCSDYDSISNISSIVNTTTVVKMDQRTSGESIVT